MEDDKIIKEDDKLRALFSDFQPDLPSSFQFMSKLQKNMESVEIVKRHNAALRRRNRLAVAIAAVCGFATGILLTLLLPLIEEWTSTISISLPLLQIGSEAIDYGFIAWIIMGVVSVVTALNAYEIAMVKLAPKESDV